MKYEQVDDLKNKLIWSATWYKAKIMIVGLLESKYPE